ncbi:MAG: SpoIIIAH-like family protein [Clostridia bacterium]|nr:SpoIIIAH-like family protein [Clostridia bacterium]
MNKLEKIRNTSGELIEREDVEREVPEEEVTEESKKTFSFFKLWRKCQDEGENEDVEFVNEEELVEDRSPTAFRLLNKKTTVLAACILVIGVAGFLNVRYSNPAETIPPVEKVDDIGIASSSVDESDGEIVNVENNDDYFALAVINRERVRDEAIEMLKDVAGSDSTDVSAKNEAYVEMTRMANEIANEANIESLVKAKGFTECVAVISNDTANVIVESDGLTINEVAQIKEIVYLECGVLPDNIKIIEKSEV